MTTPYKVIFLYFRKGFTTQEIAMLLDIDTKKVDEIIDQEWTTVHNLQKDKFLVYGEFELEDAKF